jgi:hypothetical protein
METEAHRKLRRVDFHDGHPIGVAWNGWTLLLDYENWKEEIIRLKFRGVAFVSGYGGGAPLCSAAVSCDCPEIEQAKQRLSNDLGSNETWKTKDLTHFVISDDVPLLTIIFDDVEIERLSDHSESIDSKFAEFHGSET